MATKPMIAFIDRNGKATAVEIPIPANGKSAMTGSDRNGVAFAFRVYPPQSEEAAGTVADRSGKSVAVKTQFDITRYPFLQVFDTTFPWTDGAWFDDWSCGGLSEDFDAPPLTYPPWYLYGPDDYKNGMFTGTALNDNTPAYPRTSGADFFWDPDYDPANRGAHLRLGEMTIGGLFQRYCWLYIVAENRAPKSFRIEFISYHEEVGAHSAGPYTYVADPDLLDGERFTVVIHEPGLITANFYGKDYTNGGAS